MPGQAGEPFKRDLWLTLYIPLIIINMLFYRSTEGPRHLLRNVCIPEDRTWTYSDSLKTPSPMGRVSSVSVELGLWVLGVRPARRFLVLDLETTDSWSVTVLFLHNSGNISTLQSCRLNLCWYIPKQVYAYADISTRHMRCYIRNWHLSISDTGTYKIPSIFPFE